MSPRTIKDMITIIIITTIVNFIVAVIMTVTVIIIKTSVTM